MGQLFLVEVEDDRNVVGDGLGLIGSGSDEDRRQRNVISLGIGMEPAIDWTAAIHVAALGIADRPGFRREPAGRQAVSPLALVRAHWQFPPNLQKYNVIPIIYNSTTHKVNTFLVFFAEST